MNKLACVIPLSEGAWLREAVAKSGTSTQKFADAIGVSRATLFSWFNRPIIPADLQTLLKILATVKVPIDDVITEWEEARRMLRDPYRIANEEQAFIGKLKNRLRYFVDAEAKAEFNDRSVEPYSEQPVPAEIPTFDMSVAAGPWADVTDIAEVFHPGQIDHGFFRVRISGESMKPDYTTGMVIEFQCLREGRDKLIRGRDYYVQKRDGTATFKRLKEIHEDRLVFVALNQRVCKGPMQVERSEIVRMAIARGEYRSFE